MIAYRLWGSALEVLSSRELWLEFQWVSCFPKQSSQDYPKLLILNCCAMLRWSYVMLSPTFLIPFSWFSDSHSSFILPLVHAELLPILAPPGAGWFHAILCGRLISLDHSSTTGLPTNMYKPTKSAHRTDQTFGYVSTRSCAPKGLWHNWHNMR